ncbi:YrhC family protein [Aciduricibacillus chroicocephali]|uniref:YrhC family protein n=1 Tax=Aciduricibacillus chroicocephali TaxID=3054939 RepID=A0ABY9KRV5_9BACI|nr:YrhC family protein [Bacillaceae bacterium 44XB]
MKETGEQLMAKLRDYNRFAGTLIVMGVYFYIGTLIQIYIRHAAGGTKYALLSIGFAVSAMVFLLKAYKIRRKIQEEDAC